MSPSKEFPDISSPDKAVTRFFSPRPKFSPDLFISTERRIPIVIFHCKRFHGCFSIEQIKYFLFRRVLNNKEPKIEPYKHFGWGKVTKMSLGDEIFSPSKFFPD